MKRLDKILSESGYASRKDIKYLVKKGRVFVDGSVAKAPEMKISDDSVIEIDGEKVELLHPVVLIMNKPSGFVTSTEDPNDRTVMELVPEKYRKLGVVPAGRLDKETEGLLVLTNDGNYIHTLISPKSEVRKTYYVEHEGTASEEDVKAFETGIILKDGSRCKPAELKILEQGKCEVSITEGMYHQVKRMMASRKLHVTFLKRLSEGPYSLDGLETGQCREVEFK